MTNIATMPIYGKILKTSSTPEPIDRWPWNSVCSIEYASICITKIIQIITLGWPWPILRQSQFGHLGFSMGKSENYLFLRNYCRTRSQSWLNYSTKNGNEAKWVSKVNFWPWPKVTQISKLKLVYLRILGSFETKVHMKNHVRIRMKIYTEELGHVNKMTAMLIYGENL